MATASFWDIDIYLNQVIPRSRLHLLPQPISRFLGYRPPQSIKPQSHPLAIWAWCFIGAFLGVALIEAVYLHLPTLDNNNVPLVIASFGAAAILEYNTIESPLAQPRNLVFGHFFAALIGVCITKLFHLLPESDFERLRWLAGALSVGAASVVMSITKTVHPPAGATALLAATDTTITGLGWWLLPLILLGSMLMLISALIVNNIMRQYPMYWWTPVDLAAQRQVKQALDLDQEGAKDDKIHQEKEGKEQALQPGSETATEDEAVDSKNDVIGNAAAKQQRLRRRSTNNLDSQIIISGNEIVVPHWFQTNDWELSVLQIVQQTLASVSHSENPISKNSTIPNRSRSRSRDATS